MFILRKGNWRLVGGGGGWKKRYIFDGISDFSEYERLKSIERHYHDLKSRHSEGTKKTEAAPESVEQVGQGQIPTGFLQKQALTEENGPSEQTIVENPTAPVIFTSSNEPQQKKSKKQNSTSAAEGCQKQEKSEKKEKSTSDSAEKSEQETLKFWWYIGDG